MMGQQIKAGGESLLLGAIAGDVIGSVYEFNNTRKKGFHLFSGASTFTDDTVLTVAVAEAILLGKPFGEMLLQYGRLYSERGYGGRFLNWLDRGDLKPYNSYGNGAAMRVSGVGFGFRTLNEVLAMSKRSSIVTHNHPEGIRGAQAVAGAIFLARSGHSKGEIKDYIEQQFYYDLGFTLDEIRADYRFDVSCQGSVPQAIVAFLESVDYEDALRGAISIGGDSDTIAAIAGGIAGAYYRNIPGHILHPVTKRLPLPMIQIINRFDQRFNGRQPVMLVI